jgi:DNA-binding NarL/FixJ family response regulator
MAKVAPPRASKPSGKLAVGVCLEDASLRDQVCAALVAGGHAIFAREESVEALLSSCNGKTPAAIVLGARRPDRSVVSEIAAVRSALDEFCLVLVCERASGAEVRRALELGMDGLVLTDRVDEALAAVITVVCAGQVSVPRDRRGEVRAHVLTTREKQILGLVVMGLTNGEIARKLYLAESTVKSHLSSAFAKLGVASRNEAVNVILDPERGRGLGILTIPGERVPSPA